LIAYFKTLMALLGLSAVLTEIVTLIHRGTFDAANFFSYFTIQSNLFVSLMFALSALAIWQGRPGNDLVMFRGAATLYMVITGIVFTTLLSGIDGATFTAVPWDNVVLHYLIPFAALVDWLVDPPPQRIEFRRALIWLAYAVAYAIFSLVRGHFVDWYPYPFLDPAENGIAGLIGISSGMVVLSGGLIWLLLRRTGRRPALK